MKPTKLSQVPEKYFFTVYCIMLYESCFYEERVFLNVPVRELQAKLLENCKNC